MNRDDESSPSGWRSAFLLALSLLPALLAVLPLTMGPAWYLSADENEPYLSPGRVIWMLALVVIAAVPFVATAVALLSVKAVGETWVQACRVASRWALGLGLVAVLAAMASGGGF